MSAAVIRADARSLPLPDGSVDLICTSPPFLNLRSYTDGGTHYPGQIGTGTLDQYLQDLWEVTAEMARVLKPVGSIFVELGDSYTDKSLNDAPFRYAVGCRDKLGLIRRATIVWHHVNGLPESVTDRVRSAHSYVFHFTRQPRYYSAVDEVREPHTYPNDLHFRGKRNAHSPGAHDKGNNTMLSPLGKLPGSVWEIPSQPLTVPARLGTDHFAAWPMALPRRVIAGWSPPGICTACGEGRRPVSEVQAQRGLTGDLIESRRREPTSEQAAQIRQLLIRCREKTGLSRGDVSEGVVGSPSGACWNWESGLRIPGPEHWRALKRVLSLPDDWDYLMLDTYMRPSGQFTRNAELKGRRQGGTTGLKSSSTITGYACACPQPDAPTRPAIVADPFGGTGTTALVADALGRHGLSFDRSADYCRLARWRTTDPGERAKAMQVPKPPPVMDGQGALFA